MPAAFLGLGRGVREATACWTSRVDKLHDLTRVVQTCLRWGSSDALRRDLGSFAEMKMKGANIDWLLCGGCHGRCCTTGTLRHILFHLPEAAESLQFDICTLDQLRDAVDARSGP